MLINSALFAFGRWASEINLLYSTLFDHCSGFAGPKNSWMNKFFGVGVLFIYLVQVATVNSVCFQYDGCVDCVLQEWNWQDKLMLCFYL